MDVEITVINDSNIVGWLASATRIGEIYMKDVSSMVKNVLEALHAQDMLSRLNILDHGNKDGIEIGSDWVDVTTLPIFRATLKLLAGHFAKSGFVHLQHCNVGQDRPLLIELAKIFGVSVYAGTGKHNPVYRFNLGQYVRANPDGTFDSNVDRP
jgi:hypothetical protein